jgi:hypothetical protein
VGWGNPVAFVVKLPDLSVSGSTEQSQML